MNLHGYFDYNATTPLCAEAKTAWCEAVDGAWMNPSSPYRAAAKVYAQLDEAREGFAALLGVDAKRVVFNSGATEGNNAVFQHWATTLPSTAKVGVSPTEHPSVIEAAKHHFSDRVVWLGLDVDGVVDIVALEEQLKLGTIAAVSVMAVNNETGILNPWEAIADLCHETGCVYHCDASQWIGKLPLNKLAQCDYVTGCAHKFGGPRGVGFLIAPATGASFESLLGGVQQAGRRAGTEDVAGILAMVAALRSGSIGNPTLRDEFLAELRDAIPGIEIIGDSSPRIWNTVSVMMPAFASERWIRALEKRGFFVSSGSACSTAKDGPSHVLAAMGVDASAMRRVLRISSGGATSEDMWSALLVAMVAVYDELRADAAGSNAKVISI